MSQHLADEVACLFAAHQPGVLADVPGGGPAVLAGAVVHPQVQRALYSLAQLGGVLPVDLIAGIGAPQMGDVPHARGELGDFLPPLQQLALGAHLVFRQLGGDSLELLGQGVIQAQDAGAVDAGGKQGADDLVVHGRACAHRECQSHRGRCSGSPGETEGQVTSLPVPSSMRKSTKNRANSRRTG